MNMIGPNVLPIAAVPNCCKKKNATRIASTIITMVFVCISWRAGIFLRPSTADVMEMGGVIIPSANSAAPPSIAGKASHFFRRRTNAYKAKVPPSPLLSALSIKITYLIVVCKVSVQIMHDSVPMMSSWVIVRPPIIALKTYRGEVPISPYIIPIIPFKHLYLRA